MPLSNLKGNLISYDTETTGLNPWNSAIYKKYGMFPARPFAFAFCDQFENFAYIRWEVDPKNRMVIQNKREARAISDLLGNPHIRKIGHNIQFDIRMTRLSGMKFDWSRVDDTLFMAHILTGGSFFSYGLKPLAEKWLDIGTEDQEDLLKSVRSARLKSRKFQWAVSNKETHGKEHIKSDMWLGDRELCKKYALGDVGRVMVLYQGMKTKFNGRLKEVYDMEIRLMREIYRAEGRGVNIRPEKLLELEKFYGLYYRKWMRQVKIEGGTGLNLDSPAQLVRVFCKERGHETRNRTGAGNPSIDAAELARLAKKDSLARAVLECKASKSMIVKFIQPYRRFMAPQNETTVLHANFHQIGPVTGRLSCSEPNLEQVAAADSAKKKADIGLRPREVFYARNNHVLYMPDYSQMEVWVFAFVSKNRTLMKALLSGLDVHTAVAEPVWGSMPDWEEHKKFYRKKGKTLMFLKIYGGGAKAASELLECSWEEAQEAIDQFDHKLPEVNEFIEQTAQQAEREGYVENLFGRQYCIDSRYSYKAVNYIVQGTCADIVKRAMIRLAWYFRKNCRPTTRWLIPLHDELYIEVHKADHSTILQKNIIRLMQADSKKLGLPIPLPVTMKISYDSWANAKEVV